MKKLLMKLTAKKQQERKVKKSRKGFTLIELIVVIAIIGILATVLMPKFAGFTESSKKMKAVSNARNIAVAMEALEAESKTIDKDTIEAYLGKQIKGSYRSLTGSAFEYYITEGTKYISCTYDGSEVTGAAITTTVPTGTFTSFE